MHVITTILGQLICPLTISIVLVLFGLLATFRRRRRMGAALSTIGLVILIMFSSPWCTSLLTGSLESRYAPLPESEAEAADAIVLLGGGVGSAQPPRSFANLTDASDRDLHAARLFKSGRAPLVIVCGSPPEAVDLLVEWGVRRESIIEEAESRTTRQNAVNARQIIEDRELKRVLLVTSAMHMPSADALFKSTRAIHEYVGLLYYDLRGWS